MLWFKLNLDPANFRKTRQNSQSYSVSVTKGADIIIPLMLATKYMYY